MAEWLKRGATSEARADSDRKVRDIVEGILADIAARGNEAVRELSIKFDGWDRESYQLTKAEMQNCIDQMSGQDLKDMMIGEYCSRLWALEGFAGHGEQANIRVRRFGDTNVPYAGRAEA